MNEEAKKVAIEYIQKLLGLVEKGADFAGEQIPLVLQEIVGYGRAYETAICVIFGLLTILTPWIMYLGLKKADHLEKCGNKNDADGVAILTMVVGVIVLLPSLITFFTTIDDCLKAWFAPRLYVIEYLHELAKSGK